MSSILLQPISSYDAGLALDHLPRLIYVGDVAVESTVAGSTLLYRLLQKYPDNRLRIAEGNLKSSRPDKRLPGVKYDEFRVGIERLLRTRFHSLYSSALHLTATGRTRKLNRVCEDFMPEAILTVAHGYSWLTAALLARKLGLPLHLVVHDDLVSVQKSVLPASIFKRVERAFGEVYRQAESRLCASPYMAEDFAGKYGAAGTALYPSRASDVPEFTQLPNIRAGRNDLVFAFAGTINSRGYADSLATLASVLENVGGGLIVYSNLTVDGIKDCGLDRSNVTVRPIMPFKELLERLRRDVDVLFVPMSFAREEARNMKLAFPSKLADYTAAGLPLLIWGPPYCSAVRWAHENTGVAEIVDQPETEALAASIIRLRNDAPYRYRLAETALTKGREFFAHEVAIEKFYRSICTIYSEPK
ncbi:MAG TPA: hypothetical protein VF553_04400 [Pyrinomonadaceae bacterium]|jgi:glycosyltransferase involved in cell wall biosynthesis